jgi:hypothetical protein
MAAASLSAGTSAETAPSLLDRVLATPELADLLLAAEAELLDRTCAGRVSSIIRIRWPSARRGLRTGLLGVANDGPNRGAFFSHAAHVAARIVGGHPYLHLPPYRPTDAIAYVSDLRAEHEHQKEAFAELPCLVAMQLGQPLALESLMGVGWAFGPRCCQLAAERGDVATLRWAHAGGLLRDGEGLLLHLAAERGHMPVVRLLVEEARLPMPSRPSIASNPCERAAAAGDLPLLQYLRAHRCPWSETAACAAAAGGHLNVLRWMDEQGGPAARAGTFIALAAAGAGQVGVLAWLRGVAPGAVWGPRAARAAAEGGHLSVLAWAAAQVPPLPVDVQDEDLQERVAARGDLPMLDFLAARGAVFTPAACVAAAAAGHVPALALLRSLRPPAPWGAAVTTAAAASDQLAALRWLRAQEPPCPWDAELLREAALRGFMPILEWARAQQPPCPWDETVTDGAYSGVRPAVLRWLRGQEPPCPWGERLPAMAAGAGQLDFLDALLELRHPALLEPEGHAELQAIAARWYQDDVLRWLHAHPVPASAAGGASAEPAAASGADATGAGHSGDAAAAHAAV